MRPLFYILKKSLKNSIRELARKPLTLIAYILMAIFFIFMLVMSFIAPSGLLHKGSAETFGALVLMAILVVVYFGIRQGITSGNSFFRLADVNLVFTAPISPKQVLVYGFIQQFFLILMVVLFISFQIPNLKNNFAIGPTGILVIIVSVILLFFSMQLIGMLVYSISSKSARIRSNLEKALNILVGLFLAGFMVALLERKDLMQAAAVYLDSRVFNYIPLIGWFKILLMAAVKGTGPVFFIDLALVLASIALMIFVLYALKTDYYEDVLAATEYREQMLKAKKEGSVGWNLKNTGARKVTYEYTKTGAAAILQRHILEYKKTGLFFVDKFSLVIIAIGIASKYFFPFSSMKTVLYSSVYMLFFFSMQGKWVQELGMPFIYLIPARSAAKVFYATLTEILKNGIDGLLLFTVAGLMFKADIVTIALCALSYMTFGAVYTYGDVLARKLFGQAHSRNLAIFVKMLLLLFIFAPGIIISAVSGFIFNGTGYTDYISFLALIVYNILACVIMVLLASGIFEKLEMG